MHRWVQLNVRSGSILHFVHRASVIRTAEDNEPASLCGPHSSFGTIGLQSRHAPQPSRFFRHVPGFRYRSVDERGAPLCVLLLAPRTGRALHHSVSVEIGRLLLGRGVEI